MRYFLLLKVLCHNICVVINEMFQLGVGPNFLGSEEGSVMVDIFTKKKRSQIMTMIKSKNTVPERLMAKSLKQLKIGKFRRGDRIFGRPDFIFPESKVAIFVDGRFWHGYGYSKSKQKLTPFWRSKIGDNIKRDKVVNNRLKREGWKVLRFWDYEVKGSPEICLREIEKAVEA